LFHAARRKLAEVAHTQDRFDLEPIAKMLGGTSGEIHRDV
jgi:hypothetical protein